MLDTDDDEEVLPVMEVDPEELAVSEGDGDRDNDRVIDVVTEGDIVTDGVVDDDNDLDGVTVGDGFTHDVLPGLDT